jgi:hypothetical protein
MNRSEKAPVVVLRSEDEATKAVFEFLDGLLKGR